MAVGFFLFFFFLLLPILEQTDSDFCLYLFNDMQENYVKVCFLHCILRVARLLVVLGSGANELPWCRHDTDKLLLGMPNLKSLLSEVKTQY